MPQHLSLFLHLMLLLLLFLFLIFLLFQVLNLVERMGAEEEKTELPRERTREKSAEHDNEEASTSSVPRNYTQEQVGGRSRRSKTYCQVWSSSLSTLQPFLDIIICVPGWGSEESEEVQELLRDPGAGEGEYGGWLEEVLQVWEMGE